MKKGLKQRAIGAVVLTSLAIIILPILLDGSAEDRARVVASIPEPPKFDLQEITINDLNRKMQQMKRDSAAQLPKETVDETDYSEVEEVVLDKNNLPVAWSLQLGAFRNQANAEKLRGELRDAEFRSYILQTNIDGGVTYKVFVGPMMGKAALEQISEKLQTTMNLEGRIIRYRVEDDATQLGG